ncbi:hypothetical protein COW64_08475 [bacterium (Candidatus Blackallbacteria) CG18_big_fil_WC_8_21_14_2_50_49_26]|nr:MAG: hypothetical protein COW64_08475 [bacterium (Candidatus Blackallbacteria) CG18_big_fil_WC_8_21_14_2_50_49_26]
MIENSYHVNRDVFAAIQKSTKTEHQISQKDLESIEKAMAKDQLIDADEAELLKALKSGTSFTVRNDTGKEVLLEPTDLTFPDVKRGAAVFEKGQLKNVDPLTLLAKNAGITCHRIKPELFLKAAQGDVLAQQEMDRYTRRLIAQIDATLKKAYPEEAGKQENMPETAQALYALRNALAGMDYTRPDLGKQLDQLQGKLFSVEKSVNYNSGNATERESLDALRHSLKAAFSAESLVLPFTFQSVTEGLKPEACSQAFSQFAANPQDPTPIERLQVQVADTASRIRQTAYQIATPSASPQLSQALKKTADALEHFAHADLSTPAKVLAEQQILRQALEEDLGGVQNEGKFPASLMSTLEELHVALSSLTDGKQLTQSQAQLDQNVTAVHDQLRQEVDHYQQHPGSAENSLYAIKEHLKSYYQQRGLDPAQQPAVQAIDLMAEQALYLKPEERAKFQDFGKQIDALMSQIDDPVIKDSLDALRGPLLQGALLDRGESMIKSFLRANWQAGNPFSGSSIDQILAAVQQGMADQAGVDMDDVQTKKGQAFADAVRLKVELADLRNLATDPDTRQKLDQMYQQLSTEFQSNKFQELTDKCQKLSVVQLAKEVFNGSVPIGNGFKSLRGISVNPELQEYLRDQGMEEKDLKKLIEADKQLRSTLMPMLASIKTEMTNQYVTALCEIQKLKGSGKVDPVLFYQKINAASQSPNLDQERFLRQTFSLTKSEYEDFMKKKSEGASDKELGKFLLDKLSDVEEDIQDELKYIQKANDPYTSTFEMLKKYPSARANAYKLMDFKYCRQHTDSFPIMTGGKDVVTGIMKESLVGGRLDNANEAAFLAVAEDWDDDETLKSGLIDAAVFIASTAIACIPGGAAASAGLVALKTSLQVGLYVGKFVAAKVEADDQVDIAKAGVQTGTVSIEDLNQLAERAEIGGLIRDQVVDFIASKIGIKAGDLTAKLLAKCPKLVAEAAKDLAGALAEEGSGVGMSQATGGHREFSLESVGMSLLGNILQRLGPTNDPEIEEVRQKYEAEKARQHGSEAESLPQPAAGHDGIDDPPKGPPPVAAGAEEPGKPPRSNGPPSGNSQATTFHPDAHAIERHGGNVTDSQLKARAVTGIAPDLTLEMTNNSAAKRAKSGEDSYAGHIVVRPPMASAFWSDDLLLWADQQVRNGGALAKALQRNGLDNATILQKIAAGEKVEVTVTAEDVGDMHVNLGRGFERQGEKRYDPSKHGPQDAHTLTYVPKLQTVGAKYVFDPASGTWQTITIYPDKLP